MKNKGFLQRILGAAVGAALVLGGCAPSLPAAEAEQYFRPVSELTLPDEATLVGLGEATHGNAEFGQLRLAALQVLVERYGFRAMALEGDFGGCQVVNDYLLNGTGSAEDAARQIGFAIYRTQEMVELIEWMRAYNLSAAPDQQIHFYGFDMQRYDHNKRGLLAYIELVDPERAAGYEAALADLNDDTVFDQQREKIQAGLAAIQGIRADLAREKDRYVAASSAAAFDLADQFAQSIEQNATLRGTDVNYSETRDLYMAEKVAWIMTYEQAQGRGKLFLAGHDGHIEKSAAAAMYRSMGSRLAETFGARYFAIGTDFYESTFLCKEAGSGERKSFTVKNANALNKVFYATGLDQAYLDLSRARENPTLEKLITVEQSMSNIGDEFNGLYRWFAPLYTLRMVPVQAYDGLILIRQGSPVTMLAD